jgi:glutamate synthase (NADPH/NADH) large chain
MVDLDPLDEEDRAFVHEVVSRHVELTGSAVGGRVLDAWDLEAGSFRKVMPKDYRRVLEVMREAESDGLAEEETLSRVMAAAHG